MTEKKKISRRKFLVRAGLGTLGVLALGTYVARNPIRRAVVDTLDSIVIPYSGSGTEANLWFEITTENKLLFYSPKVEMGQGIFTGYAQIIADELDLNLDQIEVVAANTATGIVDALGTGGSFSMASVWSPLRELSATMREMLVIEAASKMNTEKSSLTINNGVISGNGTTMTYAEVASGVDEWTVPDEVPEPKTGGYTYVGQPVPRIDLTDKVFGKTVYGLDAEMPGMLYASITRPEIVGAKLAGTNLMKAKEMPGVVDVIQMNSWVGVIAESYPQALQAKNELDLTWTTEKIWTEEELRDTLQVGKGDRAVTQKEGRSLDDSDSEAVTISFTTPIGAHAQLEPNGAVASYEDGKVTIILSTQVPGATQSQVAEALDIPAEDVNIIPTQLGGGFGRRLDTTHAIQAALLSKETGKPIKYIYTRKEEFQHDLFRPPTHHIMKGKLDGDGELQFLEHHYSSGDVAINAANGIPIVNTILGSDLGAGRGAAIMYKTIPNQRVVQWHTTLPFATSMWRSLGLMANTFAIESFIDEMAIRADKNPVDFRLRNLPADEEGIRIRRVIEEAAEISEYSDDIHAGRAMGFAASIDANVPVAHVVEVSIDEGKIKIHKACCVMDCGLAVNPDQVKAQCEGSIIMGASASLYEKMTLNEGVLEPTIYGPYKMAMIKDAPKEIDVHLISGIEYPLPVGEPPLGPIGAAIGNAVRRATGIRLTDIPLQPALDHALANDTRS